MREYVTSGTFPLSPLVPNAKSLRFSLVAIELYDAQTRSKAGSK